MRVVDMCWLRPHEWHLIVKVGHGGGRSRSDNSRHRRLNRGAGCRGHRRLTGVRVYRARSAGR